jgi:hypothetical protein
MPIKFGAALLTVARLDDNTLRRSARVQRRITARAIAAVLIRTNVRLSTPHGRLRTYHTEKTAQRIGIRGIATIVGHIPCDLWNSANFSIRRARAVGIVVTAVEITTHVTRGSTLELPFVEGHIHQQAVTTIAMPISPQRVQVRFITHSFQSPVAFSSQIENSTGSVNATPPSRVTPRIKIRRSPLNPVCSRKHNSSSNTASSPGFKDSG